MVNQKITVELSTQDRNLLKDIRDALRSIGIGTKDEDEAAETVRRLVETYPVDPTGAIEEHFDWNGSGWVPKREPVTHDGVHAPVVN